jgi:arylsulfatase A-like enzyme
MEMRSRPNIVLLIMESIRPDLMGCYGGPVPNTPRLQALAESGLKFRNAVSAGGWTVASIGSMFTGLYPSEHRLLAGSDVGLQRDIRTLPELLQDVGYQTRAIFSTDLITDYPDFLRGFHQYVKTQDQPGTLVELLRRPTVLLTDRHYAQSAIWNLANGRDARTFYITLILQEWLDQLIGGDPFFVFVHFQMPHAPYAPPRPFVPDLSKYGFDRAKRRRLNNRSAGYHYMAGAITLDQQIFSYYRELYAAEIRYLDWRIGQVVDMLDARGLLENTLLIAIGDHGENIGDHELMYHNFSVYETITHVPWIMAGPGLSQYATQVETPVSHTDLLPTILELVGGEVRQRLQGESVLSFLSVEQQAESPDRCVFTELERPQSVLRLLYDARPNTDFGVYDKAMKAARTHRWKYIAESDGSEYLYDLLSDPSESINLARTQLDTLEDLRYQMRLSIREFDLLDPTLI